MQFEKYNKRLSHLEEIIRNGNTGPPKEIAKILNISKRMLYRYIGLLNEKDKKVKYNRMRLSNFY